MDDQTLVISKEISEKLTLLQKKFDNDNQDITIYLDKLRESKYLSYWDYIKLDTLLTLQNPQTDYHDEMIFVIFHQVTELYFKLILVEIQKASSLSDRLDDKELLLTLRRLNHYLDYVAQSFQLVSHVMRQDEFQKFRSALFPASGFQSIQYRMIEIASTELFNLTDEEVKTLSPYALSIEQSFQNLYWKKGATDKKTGVQSLTLRQFEEKYAETLLHFAYKMESSNLLVLYKKVIATSGENEDVKQEMRKYDYNFNVKFGLAHLKAAVNHLKNSSSTGGTNWQQYLPPKYQKTIFFPMLWTQEEIKNWGREYLLDSN